MHEMTPPYSVLSTEAMRPRVLIADDNADMRDYVARLLAERFEVVAVADGRAALERARAMRREGRPPELVLSDVMIPQLGGFGLLRALREDPALKTIPVMLLSARAEEEERIEGLEHGADDYLIKPFSAQQLLARVEAQVRMATFRRESERRLRDFADTAPAMLWVTEADGSCSFLSRGWYEYTGQTEEEGLGFGWLKAVHADDREESSRIFLEANRRHEPFILDYRLRRADGEYRWCMDAGRPRFEERGAFQGYVGSVIDITERRLAERSIKESEERLRLAMGAGDMGAWEIDLRSGTVIWDAKQHQIFGWPQDRQPKNMEEFYALLHPDDVDRIKRAAVEGLTGRFHEEFRILRDDGAVRWIAGLGATLTDQDGRPVRMVGVNYDMTERKEAQVRLEQFAEELERQVTARTAELLESQARLRALGSELNLVEQRERKRLATELHDHLQQMLVVGKLTIAQGKRVAGGVPACETALKKVDDILSEALNYSRTLVAELSPPVLRDHGLAASLKWLAGYMKKKHEQTVIVIAPDGQDLKLPEGQVILLFQSVRELLINSSKHAGTGQATVVLEQRDGLLRIEVRDEGAGFDLAAAAAAAAGAPSVGLSSKFGLLSIQERMRALGGSFEIESAPGKGTTATLMLPLRSSAECSVPSAEPSGIAAHVRAKHWALRTQHSGLQQNPKIRVLLVDDHVMVRQGLRAVLDAYADVELIGEAGNGEEAVQLMDQLRPQVVVMDINMPKMNGIEATRHIKIKWPEITVIGISVNTGDDNGVAMKRAGATTILPKDTAVEQLHNAIQQAVTKGARPHVGFHAS
ncbi:MAG: putative histidine-kinase [Nitrospira sp.]|jgi:PAS domain S-box-containing protein|nr:MAG: putative histidine-kinase [Nitrospira sp.]